MATITKIGDFQDKSGSYNRRIFLYTGPASYATGGDSLTPEAIGLGKIEGVAGVNPWNGSAVRLLAYDRANKKLVWYVPNTGSEVSAATDLSAYTALIEVIGK